MRIRRKVRVALRRGVVLAFALAALGAIGTPARKAPEPELTNGDPRLTLARQHPGQMRYLRTATGTIAIPPRRA